MTTTHLSAGRRRRQRLRRTLVVTTVLVVAGGAAGYAAWHDDGPSHSAAASPAAGQHRVGPDASSSAKTKSTAEKPAPSSTSASSGGAKGTGGTGFSPVVTDRIPTPTTSLPLSAPIPGMTNMQAPAAAAFKRAFAAARVDGLTPEIRSAWRSAEWQQILFDRAVTKYGSRAEAAKWVLSPARSAHVKGYAIDVHPQAVASWLEEHGSAYGLCRTYDNEWWHFEYLASSTCPPRQPTAAG
jgi:LAS superfamily LD-carboxypeptidase LdcB